MEYQKALGELWNIYENMWCIFEMQMSLELEMQSEEWKLSLINLLN